MDKYLVVGSPGRYTVIPVKQNDKDYESGMSEQAAQETADILNAQFVSGTTTAIPKSEPKQDLSSTSFAEPEPVFAAPQPEKEESVIDRTRTMAAAAQVIQSNLRGETEYIKNFVKNQQAIRKAQEENKDTRSLIEKETDYIKQFVEEKSTGKDIDFGQQLIDETKYIKDFVNNVVDKVEVKKQKDTDKDEDEIIDIVVDEENKKLEEDTTTNNIVTNNQNYVGTAGSNQETGFNNIPTGAKVFDVDGDYYLGYLVPGGDGSLYTGSIYMMYQVPNNDFVKSGLLTDASAFKGANSFLTKEDLNTGGAIVAGTTAELEGIEGNPFLQFVERINAEVALEGRDPTPGEYRQLKWFQETTEEQRDWYELSLGRGFSNLPLDAKQAYENTRRNVKNNLLTLGIAGGFDPETGMLRDVPPGLVDYISQKAVSGEWSELKTTEQLRLFADPFAAGERDEAFFNVVEAGGYDQIDRQMQYEDTVRQEALKWLGPVAGNYNSTWVANWGSRLRSGEADAFQQLQTMLKQQRVALFDAYTNPELTYEDISQPWRNIAENAWGEVPDENQTYFQDIVKNNNVTYANEVLTKVGLEQGNDKVVNDALNSLEQSIGQGTVRRNLGANT
jgi:hypothetical protein